MDKNKIKELKDDITERLDELIDMFIDLRDEIAYEDNEEEDNEEDNEELKELKEIKKLEKPEFISSLHPVEQTLIGLCLNAKPCDCEEECVEECVYDFIDDMFDNKEIEDWINEPEKYIDLIDKTSPKTEEWEILLGSTSGSTSGKLDNQIISDDITNITINLSTSTADARLTITGVPFKDIPRLHALIDKVCNRAHEEADDFETQEEYIND